MKVAKWVRRFLGLGTRQALSQLRRGAYGRQWAVPRLEELEPRLTPANYTWNSPAGTLVIDLGTNESLAVVGGPGTQTFSLSGGTDTFTQLGGNTASGSGTATLSFAATANISTSITVTNTIAGAGTNNVSFTSGTLITGAINVSPAAAGTTTAITVAGQIQANGTMLLSGNGPLTISAGAQVYGATITMKCSDINIASTATVGNAVPTALGTTPTATITAVGQRGGLATDSSGNLYVGDNFTNAINIFPPGATTPSATLTGVKTPFLHSASMRVGSIDSWIWKTR
jgi:hypothetical protein